MKRLLIGCLAVPLFATACGDPLEVATPSNSGINTVKQGVAPNRYIVVLNPGTNASSSAQQLAAAHGGNVTAVWEHALNGFAIEISPQGLNGLQNNPAVKYVEPDIVMSKLDQTAPTGIPRIEADLDPVATAGSVDATVAIIDTGIDGAHPDLDGLVLAHVDCAGGGPHGRKGCESGGTDGNGHGTHVAGTVAALDNDIGVVGVAPGADLVGVRVLDDRGSGYMSWIINGVDWVTQNKAQYSIDVANMSLGGAGESTALEEAIGNSVAAGILYTVAAGNSSADIHDSDGNCAYSPACIDAAMTISALADSDGAPGGLGDDTSYGPDDSFATFSNYSSLNGIDLILPGVDINSTVPGGGYDSYSGTSMAAPHAAGLAALEVARRRTADSNYNATNAEEVQAIRDALIDASREQSSDDGIDVDSDPDTHPEPLGYAIAADTGCSADSDCDDGDDCTADTCDAGTCSFTPISGDDSDGDDYGTCEGDCDDGDASTYPGAGELCDGADNDCDGSIDEGCPECVDDTDCTTDEYCSAEGTCEPAPYCGDGTCDDGEDFDSCSDDCPQCTADADCADGEYCSDQNTCESTPECVVDGESCHDHEDCCSGACTRGKPNQRVCYTP